MNANLEAIKQEIIAGAEGLGSSKEVYEFKKKFLDGKMQVLLYLILRKFYLKMISPMVQSIFVLMVVFGLILPPLMKKIILVMPYLLEVILNGQVMIKLLYV